MGRTGTMSLKLALELLGFDKCYHMVEAWENPHHIPVWRAAHRQSFPDWSNVFQGYQATVDFPSSIYYEQLMDFYPQAKVILTERDAEQWYESTKNTIYPGRNAPSTSELSDAEKEAHQMVDESIWKGLFEGRFEDRDFAINVFNQHNEEVRNKVPVDRLLIYRVEEGWDPLCRFLGVDSPLEVPFPKSNTRKEYIEQWRS